MPPFLIALGVVALAALIPRKSKVPGAPVTVQTTPATSPPGITTGFAAPPLANNFSPAYQASIPPAQTNQPSTSASGVPNWTSNAQEFNTAQYGGSPSNLNRWPAFYPGPIQANLNPRYNRVKVPPVPKQQSCGCGVGASCGCSQNASDCSVSSRRNMDGGCLAPTQRSLIRSAPPGVLQAWVANIASVGQTEFATAQQAAYDQQFTDPQGEDITIPASPHITGIGISSPLRTTFNTFSK